MLGAKLPAKLGTKLGAKLEAKLGATVTWRAGMLLGFLFSTGKNPIKQSLVWGITARGSTGLPLEFDADARDEKPC